MPSTKRKSQNHKASSRTSPKASIKRQSSSAQQANKPRKLQAKSATSNPAPLTSRDDKVSLSERVLRLLEQSTYEPSDRVSIARQLGLRGGAAKRLYEIIDALEHTGRIARVRRECYVLPRDANLLSGVIHLHPKGFAHLLSEREGEPDLFIAPANTGTAMHGDRVLVREIPHVIRRRRGRLEDDRSEGEVVRIISRARDTIVGTLQRSNRFFHVVPDDPRLPQNIYVAGDMAGAIVGDKVVVRLAEWKSRHVNPEGEIIETLGAADAPGVDILSILRKFNLPTEFPDRVVSAAQRVPESVTPADIRDRDDWRDRFVITIDPEDARDFDDAIHVERRSNGWTLAVHIADVSHYVKTGSPMDKEARRRGNSVYLPDRVIPMLPERLSNGICSLVPDENRLTRLALIDFDSHGRMRRASFRRAVIRSACRLTYEQALSLLEARPDGSPISQALHNAWSLASLLRRNRFAHGSLDLDFPEVKVLVDDLGKPTALKKSVNDISHQLVEEFMLAANEAVAREFLRRKLPTVYRVHEVPDPRRLAEFTDFVESHGITCGDLTVRENVQRLLESIHGTHEEYAIKLALLKSLQKARYDPAPLGHYGLAKANYCHFTSPIRRYADLIVHRAMEPLLDQKSADRRVASTVSSSSLKETAEHISATERNAQDAERDAIKLKKLEFFALELDKKPSRRTHFDAIIVEVRPHGMFIELPDALQTGFIRVSLLDDDFYLYDSARMRFSGRRNRRIYKTGDPIQVIVDSVDFFKKQIDFAPCSR